MRDRRLVLDTEFKEEQHPRSKKSGEFVKKGGEGAAIPSAPQIQSKDPANLGKQKHLNALEQHAKAGEWPKVEAYPTPGVNTYAKMVQKYKAELLKHAPTSGETTSAPLTPEKPKVPEVIIYAAVKEHLAKAEPEPPPQEPTAKDLSHEKIVDAGYTPTANGVYQKGHAVVKLQEDGSWESAAPGKPAVKGNGDNLDKFLSLLKEGKPVWNVDFGGGASMPGPSSSASSASYYGAKSLPLTHASWEGKQKLQAAAPAPTEAEKSAIKAYTNGAYSAINNCLRHESSCTEQMLKQRDEIIKYLKKAKTPEPVTLSRKVSGEYGKILLSILEPGASFVDRGVISTSVSGTWSGEVQMVIRVTTGAPVAAAWHNSSHPSEDEVLLPPGSHFHVTSVDRKARIIEVELKSAAGWSAE